MRTIIVSGFPGVGKSYYCMQNPDKALDLDSSSFSWVTKLDGTKERNPDFPQCYIDRIKEVIAEKRYRFVFVSSHKAVRTALKDNNLYFALVYPYADCKDEMIERYLKRGSTQQFIDVVQSSWFDWIMECQHEIMCHKIELDVDRENLSDALSLHERHDWTDGGAQEE